MTIRNSLFCLPCILCLALVGGSEPAFATEPADLARLDGWLAPLVEARDLAGHLVVSDSGRPVFKRSWGRADLSSDRPNGPETVFGVGSLTKQFTAAVTLQLAARDVLELGWTLDRWFPEIPAAESLSIEHLLGHRSGLVRDVPEGEAQDLDSVARSVLVQPPLGAPGERIEYSNAGYVVLAAVLEKVAGQSFETLVTERLLAPLGLRATGFRSGPLKDRLAVGYDPGFGPSRLQRTPDQTPRRNLGASGIIASASDLERWTLALHQGRVLEPEWLRLMTEDQGGGRGYGTGLYTRSGLRVVGHDGVENGYTAFSEFYPDLGLTVAYAGNVRTSAYEALEAGIGRLLAERDLPEIQRPETLAGVRDESLVGRYRVHAGLVLEVLDSPQGMQLLGTGGYPTPLERIDGDRWFYRALFAEIRFQRPEPSAQPTGLLWIDVQGREFEVSRE